MIVLVTIMNVIEKQHGQQMHVSYQQLNIYYIQSIKTQYDITGTSIEPQYTISQ